jgi:hypothetical protein
MLMEVRADVNQPDQKVAGLGHIMRVEKGMPSACAWPFKNKADMDCDNKRGTTGLIIAAYHGHPECLKVLMEAKANVDCWTIVMVAPLPVRIPKHALWALYWKARRRSCPLLAHGADTDAAAEEVSENKRSAASMYANTHLFIERWHEIALNALFV